jgi:hypothetical protein
MDISSLKASAGCDHNTIGTLSNDSVSSITVPLSGESLDITNLSDIVAYSATAFGG